MEICSDPEDQQTSKMHKASLLAYRVRKAGRSVRLGFGNPKPSLGGSGDAKALLLGSKESSFVANGPSALAAHGSSKARNVLITLLSESLLNKGKQTIVAPEVPALTSAFHRGQAPSTQAASAQSDGEASEERLQWPSPPSFHREASTQSVKEAPEAPGNSSHTQVLPKNFSPLSNIPKLFSVVAGKGQSSEFQGAMAKRRVARGEFPAKNQTQTRSSPPEVVHPSLRPLHPTLLRPHIQATNQDQPPPRERTPKAHHQ